MLNGLKLRCHCKTFRLFYLQTSDKARLELVRQLVIQEAEEEEEKEEEEEEKEEEEEEEKKEEEEEEKEGFSRNCEDYSLLHLVKSEATVQLEETVQLVETVQGDHEQ